MRLYEGPYIAIEQLTCNKYHLISRLIQARCHLCSGGIILLCFILSRDVAIEKRCRRNFYCQ